jgi:SAM-dependent methyltransferase
MNEILDRYVTEEIAPHMALMMLFINCSSESGAREELLGAIRDAAPASKAKLTELKNLWDRSPESFSLIAQINRLAGTGRGATKNGCVRQYRAAFDKAVSISAEGSVALYSLGNRNLLDSITSEMLALMRHWELFDANSLVADIGCGTGRFERFLAPHVGGIIGLDISGQMLQLAAEAARGFSNALFVQVAGTGLCVLRHNTCNLILAIDSFPYIVDTGGADVHFRDCARILRPRGRMLLMNFAYGSRLESQQQRVAALAADHGFAVLRNGTLDLRSWDGKSFLLEKMAT